MCEPTTIIMGITAVAGMLQTADNANKQNAAIEQGYAQQMETVAEQYRQTDQAATQQMSERAREAMIERSRLRTIAGESGAIGGVSEERIQQESQFNQGSDISTIEANRANANRQTELEAKSIRAGAKTQLSQVKQPDLIGTGLSIAGTYVGQKAKMDKLNAPQR